MSGVLRTRRRSLLSCTSIVQGGFAILAGTVPAHAAGNVTLETTLAVLGSLNRPEITILALSASVLCFSVVSEAILKRTRLRAEAPEAQLRTDNQALQNGSDRLRALVFAEPQVLFAWAAGGELPDISGDVALLMPQGHATTAQRILAFGTWLLPEQALAMDHAVDALRERGESFLLTMSTSNGRAIEAIGRASVSSIRWR